MLFSLRDSVKIAINTIENAGGEAFLVGGCVRDMLLGITPSDYDVTTSLPPEEILRLFDKAIPTGLAHGTVTVIINDESIEITTYRTDGKYRDNRHPEAVTFVRSLSEDLSRRDFTVNAIAYNPKQGIIDLFGGIEDINQRILRTVGDADKRFNEDALRIMRLFRFAAQLNFDIEASTISAALLLKDKLSGISRERIAAELFKMLNANYFEKALPLFTTGAFSFCGINTVKENISFKNLPVDRNIRFYHLIKSTNSDYSNVCAILKTDKELLNFCNEVSVIYENPPCNKTECKLYLNKYNIKSIESALILSGKDTSVLADTISSNEPYKTCDLLINGNDIKNLGFSGKHIGKILEYLMLQVIETPELNSRETLINLAKNSNIS